MLPDANSLSSRAQNRGFCALFGFGTLIFGHFEHKIGVFVLFWPSQPSFSGFSSTKSRFLCALPVAYLPQRPLPATNLIRRRSTPVWLALWHIWAGCGCRLAGAQLQDGKWCFPTALRGRTCRCAAPERLLQRRRPRHGRGRAALATMSWCHSEEAAAKGAPSGSCTAPSGRCEEPPSGSRKAPSGSRKAPSGSRKILRR